MRGKWAILAVSFVVLSSPVLAVGGLLDQEGQPEDETGETGGGTIGSNGLVLFGPSVLDDEQVFLKITNNGDEEALIHVRYDQVVLDPDRRFGFVHSLIDPEGDWSGDCPVQPLEPEVAGSGTPLFWGVGISPGFTCAYLPESELIGGVAVDGNELDLPVVPLGSAVALVDYDGHELSFTLHPGENHLLTGPLWFQAQVTIEADPEDQDVLESELVLRDDEMFRFRHSAYPGDWKDPLLKAWAVNAGAKYISSQEQIRHEYNNFFLASATLYTHRHSVELPDGSVCTREIGDPIPILHYRHIPEGTIHMESLFAKAWGAYPPASAFFIYDIPLPHDEDPRRPFHCEKNGEARQHRLLDNP